MHARIKVISWLAALGLVALAPAQQETEHQLKLDLSALIDVAQVWTLNADALNAKYRAPGFSENPFIRWANGRSVATFSKQPFSNVAVELTMLEGTLVLEEATVVFGSDGKAKRVELRCGTSQGLEAHFSQALGTEPKPGPRAALGWKKDATGKSLTWSSAQGRALLQGKLAALEPPGSEAITPPPSAEPANAPGGDLAFFVRIDELFRAPELWTLTQDALERSFATTGVNVSKSPFYQWSTTTRDSVRLARKLFSNTNTDLLMFADTVNAEEVNLDFKSGRASKLTITLLTRGNSGQVSAEKFDAVLKAAGRALGATLGVRPQRSVPFGKAIVKTDGWLWTTPHTLALLEFNAEAPKGDVEFLRLTLSPASARNELLNVAGIGGNATTRRRDSLVGSVKRDMASGSVEITGIPMRDQGAKGYCVAASCERVFRYLGVPCDMDELAKLVAADADKGASPSLMYESLKKIDQHYNMRAKLLKIPVGYGLGDAASRSEVERAWKADLGKLIQEHINQGLPLLWCVILGPGETGVSPGLPPPGAITNGPRAQQVGHMRLITGYNTRSGEVIYSDSWGAGHERKTMTRAEAEQMTTAVFSMSPSR